MPNIRISLRLKRVQGHRKKVYLKITILVEDNIRKCSAHHTQLLSHVLKINSGLDLISFYLS